MLPFVVESDELLQAKIMARAMGQRTHSCSMERQATVAKNVLPDMREQELKQTNNDIQRLIKVCQWWSESPLPPQPSSPSTPYGVGSCG